MVTNTEMDKGVRAKDERSNSIENQIKMIMDLNIENDENLLGYIHGVKSVINGVFNDISRTTEILNELDSQVGLIRVKHRQYFELYRNVHDNNQLCVMKSMIAHAYLDLLRLPRKEVKALEESDMSVAVFPILNRLSIVLDNCSILEQAGCSVLSADVSDQAQHLKKSTLEFVYNWALSAFNIESVKQSILMKKSMRAIQEDPLFFNLLDHYCNNRRAVLSHAFIDALTTTGSDNTLKPIEYHMHDLKRYVGDMLAWVHQVIPSEKEQLVNILEKCDNADKDDLITKCMSNITNGICNPLRLRIENVVLSEIFPQQLYHVKNLLRFYTKIIVEIIPQSPLEKLLRDLKDISEECYGNVFRSSVMSILFEKIKPPDSTLSPTPGVQSLLNFMSQHLSVANLTEDRELDMNNIVKYSIEPLLQALNSSSSSLSGTNLSIYMLNCYYQIHTALSFYEYVDYWLKQIQAEIDSRIDMLVSEQANSVVEKLNLSAMYNIIQSSYKIPLSQMPGLDAESIKEFTNTFESFLSSPNTFLFPQLHNLNSYSYKCIIQRRSNQIVYTLYKQIYNQIQDPVNLYYNPMVLMPHTPEYVEKVLLN